MSFRKYIENLPRPLTDLEKEDLEFNGDPYIKNAELKMYRCAVCSVESYTFFADVYVPKIMSTARVVLVHEDGVPDYCLSKARNKYNAFAEFRSFIYNERLEVIERMSKLVDNEEDRIMQSMLLSYDY